jgi:ribose-phosphate pyrophosphokinase
MTKLSISALPGNEVMAAELARHLGARTAPLEIRNFPDGELYVRHRGEIDGCDLIIVGTLDRPNEKLVAAFLAAASARELGVKQVGLVAPYLGYMRQDKRFHPGEAVTSRHIAALLSSAFAWLVTVDPHLHRYRDLSQIYTIPTKAVSAAPLLSKWIAANVRRPVIVGPDSESQQWVSAVAAAIGAPYTVMEKTRRGDRDVEVSFRDAASLTGRTPVLVDDIISTGRTMVQAVRALKSHTRSAAVCLAIHGIFAGDAFDLLSKEGAEVVTCNTVPHASNRIDVTETIAKAVMQSTGCTAGSDAAGI